MNILNLEDYKMIHEFRLCPTCRKELEIFNGDYIHPDNSCPDNYPWHRIDLHIEDEFLYKKWLEKVGTPTQTSIDIILNLNMAIVELQTQKTILDQLKTEKSVFWAVYWLLMQRWHRYWQLFKNYWKIT